MVLLLLLWWWVCNRKFCVFCLWVCVVCRKFVCLCRIFGFSGMLCFEMLEVVLFGLLIWFFWLVVVFLVVWFISVFMFCGVRFMCWVICGFWCGVCLVCDGYFWLLCVCGSCDGGCESGLMVGKCVLIFLNFGLRCVRVWVFSLCKMCWFIWDLLYSCSLDLS